MNNRELYDKLSWYQAYTVPKSESEVGINSAVKAVEKAKKALKEAKENLKFERYRLEAHKAKRYIECTELKEELKAVLNRDVDVDTEHPVSVMKELRAVRD